MSRFTEHFDIIEPSIYTQSSPSKASFFSMSSSESNTSSPRTMEPIFTRSFNSFDSSSSPSSPTYSFEEKSSPSSPSSSSSSTGNKLKRFLTTISKKKRSMSNHSS